MPYILKNNRIDKRYEVKFFEIIKESLTAEKIAVFTILLEEKTKNIRDFIYNIDKKDVDISDYERILSLIFSIRRHKGKILNTIDKQNLNKSFKVFNTAKKSSEIKIGRFFEEFDYDDIIVKKDIALEMLHFFEPDKNILWTSWIYRQDNGTGCLPYMADFLKRTWNGNPYIMPFSLKEMREEVDYIYDLSANNGLDLEKPYGADILFAYMYSDYIYKMVYAQSKSLSLGVPEGYTLMKKLLGIDGLGCPA